MFVPISVCKYAVFIQMGRLSREQFIAEERRLVYVAMTRAKRIFYFSSSDIYHGTTIAVTLSDSKHVGKSLC